LLRAQKDELYHRGIRGNASRSAVADANERRDWRIYSDLAQALIRTPRPLYADEDLRRDLDNKEFTDRFCATGERQPTGAHAFDRVCTDNRIEHRLTKPRTPQTNGMIERFNGRIADVLATTRFDSTEHLTDTIKRYVQVYNQHISQKALGLIPLQAMRN